MPTVRQRRVAKKLLENLESDTPMTGGELLRSVDYGTGLQRSPGRVLESEGVKEALNELGFNEETAKRVVQEIMLDRTTDPSARLKATDQVFKVVGSYAPERHVNLNVEVSPEEKAVARKALEGIE